MLLQKKYKGYDFKLETNEDGIYRCNYKDLTLTVSKNGTSKTWKCVFNYTFWIKIQKTQIKFMNVLEFFDNIGNYESWNLANTFADKIIAMV